MMEDIKDYLNRHAYKYTSKGDIVIVARKLNSSVFQVVLFSFLGLFMLLLGLFFIGSIQTSLPFFLIGIALIAIPFYNYFTAPYHKLLIDVNNKTMTFIKGVRFKKKVVTKSFNEVKNIELISETKDTSTDAFSDSNQEFTDKIQLIFNDDSSEELFSFTERIKSELNHTTKVITGLKSLISI
jgi:hypothetical protein